MLRIKPSLHEAVATAAAAHGMSLNQWVETVVDQAAHAA